MEVLLESAVAEAQIRFSQPDSPGPLCSSCGTTKFVDQKINTSKSRTRGPGLINKSVLDKFPDFKGEWKG